MLPSKSVYLPISKLHSILAIANLLANNNLSQICYCSQISLPRAAGNCKFSDKLKPLEDNIYFASDGPNRSEGILMHTGLLTWYYR